MNDDARSPAATPIQVRTIDVESAGRLDLDDHGQVWLVLRRGGAPRLLLELDPADPQPGPGGDRRAARRGRP
jgi:hypothetical protein